MLCPTHRSRRAGNGDALSTWAMKRRGTKSAQPRFESPPLAPAAYGCKDFDDDRGQDDQLVDDATISALQRSPSSLDCVSESIIVILLRFEYVADEINSMRLFSCSNRRCCVRLAMTVGVVTSID
jgi:hypothetical protein